MSDSRMPEFMKTYFVACTPATIVFWLLMIICTLTSIVLLIESGLTNKLVIYILINLLTIFLYSFMVTTFCRAWGDYGGWLYVLAPLLFAIIMAVFGGFAHDSVKQ